MLSTRISALKNQTIIGGVLFVAGVLVAWQLGEEVAADDMRSLMFVSLALAAVAIALTILGRWRTGFYLFLVWLMFEDLPRKYMGNNLTLFFGKDVLLGLVYISFFREVRRGREKSFKPPFLIFFSLFFWLGVLQIFNQNSPHILYGILGFKLYFYYVPLMFVGYALIRTDEDLRKFLVANAWLAGAIASLGIIQAIVGNTFLNPEHLAPELADLGNLHKVSPISNQLLSLPDSVFVSSGRFSEYMIVASILLMGAIGYLLLYTPRNRKLIFAVLGILAAATLLSGSRSAVVGVVASAVVLSAGFIWGAPWRWKQAHRFNRAIRRSFVVAALGITLLAIIFPEQAGSRIAFYVETLNPNSTAFEGGSRSWDYPVDNFLAAFSRPNWAIGNGIGTASLGTQYVAKLTGQPAPQLGVEEGFGDMIIEMGIIAPILWILWTAALLVYAWKVVRKLRETRFFPLALAILWYAFFLLYLLTYAGLVAYQNYTCNAYLWLLVGILFRLPDIAASTLTPALAPSRHARRGSSWF